MARNVIQIAAPPERVWRVLADPAAYGEWVVGTKAVPRSDAEWPTVGAALEYELGVGPISVGDRTVVVEADEPRLLLLRAEMQRLGAATIRLEIAETEGGSQVTMDEDPIEGLIELVHTRVTDALLGRRNDVALDRLKRLAEQP